MSGLPRLEVRGVSPMSTEDNEEKDMPKTR
jgi:hypothetical protein